MGGGDLASLHFFVFELEEVVRGDKNETKIWIYIDRTFGSHRDTWSHRAYDGTSSHANDLGFRKENDAK